MKQEIFQDHYFDNMGTVITQTMSVVFDSTGIRKYQVGGDQLLVDFDKEKCILFVQMSRQPAARDNPRDLYSCKSRRWKHSRAAQENNG